MQTAQLPQTIRKIIESRTGDAVFVVAPDYHIAYWDSQAEFFTGIKAEDAVGKPCYEVVLGEREGGEKFCSWGCSVMRMSQEGRPVTSYDMQIRAPSSGSSGPDTESGTEPDTEPGTESDTKRWVNVSTLSIDSEEGPYVVHLMRDTQEAHETVEMARGLIQLSKKKEDKKEAREEGREGQRQPGRRGERDNPAVVRGRRDIPALTARQLEMLEHLSEGKSVKEIKAELHLSEATVRNHIRSVLQALGAHSQLEALARARQIGLLG